MHRGGSEGIVQDVELGLKWLEKSAEQGDVNALHVLGLHYVQTQEYEKSVSHWEKTAAQGHTAAQHGLGLCYEYGLGVEQNYETYLDFIIKAAESGIEIALQVGGFGTRPHGA